MLLRSGFEGPDWKGVVRRVRYANVLRKRSLEESVSALAEHYREDLNTQDSLSRFGNV